MVPRGDERFGKPEIPVAARARLRVIFGGDDGRVDALIDTALSSLRDGAVDLIAAVQSQERERVARLAHGLKGIAIEIGFGTIAARGAALEKAAGEAAWTTVVAAYRAFTDALRCETPDVFALTEQHEKSRE
jgi:HPt (histidine-containing phosphotransfer) domain-containing protein